MAGLVCGVERADSSGAADLVWERRAALEGAGVGPHEQALMKLTCSRCFAFGAAASLMR
jgi:hypothetical protein